MRKYCTARWNAKNQGRPMFGSRPRYHFIWLFKNSCESDAMSITSAMIQLEEASDNCVLFFFCCCHVSNPFRLFDKEWKVSACLACQNHNPPPSCDEWLLHCLEQVLGYFAACVEDVVGHEFVSHRCLPDRLDCFAPSSFQLFIKRENRMQQLDRISSYKATLTNILLKSQAENRL